MFEKEAEEYTLKKLVGLEDFDSYQSAYDRYENGVQDAFKEGAEFGYNKAKEEMQKQIEKMKCCGNCAKNGHICVAEEMQGKLCGKNKVKWQLRR